ncbi:MAG: hypothetical protein KAJ42_07105, partial [Gemmatimonadetes bacterium]|nr:hypothetical protein [Gemmatimonadota bacterium]
MRPRTERRRVALALAGLVILLAPACRDLYVTNPNEPDLERALATSSDVEALIRGSFYSYWLVTHSYKPDAQFSAAADAHSSAWGGWGNDAGREPRQAFNNDPSYSYHGTVESPWERSYAALTAVRDGLKAIEEGGVTISEDGQDVTGRAVAFGHLVQALSLSSLAVIFDQAFVVHEDTDLEEGVLPEPQTPEDTLGQRLRLVPYEEVWAAAEAKYAEAIATAQGTSFTIPKQWVGNGASWTDADFVAFTKAFRARFRIQVPRTPAEREAIDWGAVLADLSGGLPFTFGSYYDGTSAGWWDGRKVYTAGKPGWVRMDNRTLGPADVSGEWEHWLTQPPHDKYPFEILTPDSRITQPMQPRTDGKYFTYLGHSPFPPSRGVYHFGHYIDHRYNHLWEAGYVGFWEDFTDKEVDFIRAEAMYRTGDKVGAMVIVNEYRANGDLPPFTTEQNPDGPNMCVPQMPDGSCGDLWEALKYEKRIECFHTSFGMEF